MENTKKLLLGILPLIIYIIVGFLFYGDHVYMVLIMLLSTFFLSYLLYFKSIFKVKKDLIYIIWLIVLILIVASIIKKDFSRTAVYIIFIPLFAFLGYLFSKKKSILLLFSVLFFCFTINFYIQPNFLIYYHSSGKENLLTNKEFPKIKLFDSDLKKYDLPKDKIIVLDFWNTSCSVCFSKFPKMNKLYNKYKDNKKVLILAVNVPLEDETFIERKEAFENEKLDFKTIYSSSLVETQNLLNFNTYPNIVILKNNKILFSGNIEPLSEVFSYYYISIDKKLENLLSNPYNF